MPTDLKLSGQRQVEKSLLRFITCGSVDDGKSTLIGRLLYDSRQILDDQMAALKRDSRRYGTTGEALDLALLVDGLRAEREQGITIDVAYRFFATCRRKFIIADTPGHTQYTRNMATGASTADLAVILVDARKGVLTQTRRHSFIVSLMGIRHAVLAVNKMDLVGWDRTRFEEIVSEYRAFADRIGIHHLQAIPLSALLGDNVIEKSAAMPWYEGPTLLTHLETVTVASEEADKPFRFPVQWINRPNSDFRGYAGTVAGGRIRPGDEVVVLPSGRRSRVDRIVTYDGDLAEATAGQAITLTLADEIDVVRGDIIAAVDEPPIVADQMAAHIIWMHDDPMFPGRPYLMRIGTTVVGAEITELKHRIDVDTRTQQAAKQLNLNEIGFCNIALGRPVAFDRYTDNRDTGGFIIIDRWTGATVGAGMVRFALRRASNLVWQPLVVDKATRARLKGQKPCVLWFTGLSGAGKSTIANAVEQRLVEIGRHTYMLDGDNVRHGLNKDLGFTAADRVENIRRVAECAKLFVEAGLIVLVSFISPFRSERDMARARLEEGEFIEIFVDTPLELCEKRDPKGLYKKAREGKLPNFTGIDSPYEPPLNPEVIIRTAEMTPEEAAEHIIGILKTRGNI